MEFKQTELSSLVREIRHSKGMNQKEFAGLCKFPNWQNVSNIETGRRKIGLNTITKICKACNMEVTIKITEILK